ncbi:helix-turn-helix transcriptional regulator [Streptomyces zhihengii]
MPGERLPGEVSPADDPAIVDLSDAERRVASLAAQGCTNREIARKLFVTVSTVEQHLTRVYRKLRINSRSDLPASLLSWVGNSP